VKLPDETLRAGSDLVLVPRHPGDANELFALVEAHRDDLRSWLTWIDATRTLGEVRRYGQFAQSQFEAKVSFDYLIVVDGVVMGGAGLHAFDWTARRAAMGYWLAPPARGRGTMTRAAAALTTHAFTHLHLHRLEIHCVVENRKSRAVAERLGYALEGTMREAYALRGEFRDLALYAMLAREWKSPFASA
jgi:ribosomal-protein-serine acetyltransferase